MGLKTSTPAKDKNTHIDRQVDLPFLKTDQVTQTGGAHTMHTHTSLKSVEMWPSRNFLDEYAVHCSPSSNSSTESIETY